MQKFWLFVLKFAMRRVPKDAIKILATYHIETERLNAQQDWMIQARAAGIGLSLKEVVTRLRQDPYDPQIEDHPGGFINPLARAI